MVVIGSPKDNNINFVSERLCAKFVRLGQDTSSTRFLSVSKGQIIISAEGLDTVLNK